MHIAIVISVVKLGMLMKMFIFLYLTTIHCYTHPHYKTFFLSHHSSMLHAPTPVNTVCRHHYSLKIFTQSLEIYCGLCISSPNKVGGGGWLEIEVRTL